MPPLWIARRAQRKGLHIQMEGSKANPNLMFFLPGMDQQQLDQLVRKELERQGVTKESDVNALIEAGEKKHELRIKTEEATKELKRLMAIKAEGGTKRLMQIGFRKWREVFYRPDKGRYVT